VWEKPRRFARGTSGCMRRGDRGPLDAGWGAGVARSGKGRARRAVAHPVPPRWPGGMPPGGAGAGARARRSVAFRTVCHPGTRRAPGGIPPGGVGAAGRCTARRRKGRRARRPHALLLPPELPGGGARRDRGGAVSPRARRDARLLQRRRARPGGPTMLVTHAGGAGRPGSSSEGGLVRAGPTMLVTRAVRTVAREGLRRGANRTAAAKDLGDSELVGAAGVGGLVGDEGHDGGGVGEATEVRAGHVGVHTLGGPGSPSCCLGCASSPVGEGVC